MLGQNWFTGSGKDGSGVKERLRKWFSKVKGVGRELKREQQEDMDRWQLGKYVKLQATSHLNEVSRLS